ncbi:MAG: hypothetical protein U1A78_02830 [Polyangia bacterium]
MRGGTRRWVCKLGLALGLCSLSARARADVVPPALAAAMAARQPEDERKLATCSPRREEEYGRYGRTVIYRQVEYDFRVGEVSADAAELRRVLTSWMSEHLVALRACAPEPGLLAPPARLGATLHVFVQHKTVRSIVVLGGVPGGVLGGEGGAPRLDPACLQRVLLQQPELPLRTAAPTGRGTVALQYAPFCVVSREADSPPPASAASYGSRPRRHLMPAATTTTPAPTPPTPPTPPPK